MRQGVRSMCGVCVASVLLALCAGCQTAKPPPDAQQQWVPAARDTQSAQQDSVWQSVRRQQVDTSHALELADLIELALQNSPDTQKAMAQARAASAQVRQYQSKYYPTATASGMGARSRTDSLSTDGTAVDDTSYQPQVQLTWLLLDLGGRNGTIEQYAQALVAANYQFNQSIQDLLLAVQTDYYTYHSARISIDAAQADVENSQKSLDAARKKLEASIGTQLDVLQAQSDYNKALATLEEAKGAYKTAQGVLARDIGLPADVELAVAPPAQAVPTNISREVVGQLIDRALTQRPDIAAARATVKSKEAAVKAASSSLWPTLSLGGSAEKTWHNYSGNTTPLPEDEYTYMGYLQLDWTLFDGFYNLNAKRAARANVDVEKAGLKATEIKASQDVCSKYYALNTAVQKLTYNQAYFDSATASFKLALSGYNAGLKNILDLLTAQSTLADARSKLIAAQKTVFVAQADLAHALGSIGTERRK